eukprot:1828938-Prymnesium_polylepis.1
MTRARRTITYKTGKRSQERIIATRGKVGWATCWSRFRHGHKKKDGIDATRWGLIPDSLEGELYDRRRSCRTPPNPSVPRPRGNKRHGASNGRK